MKRYLYITVVLLVMIVALSLYHIVKSGYSLHEIIQSGDVTWRLKEREMRSRLLAIPIILYHNIDGKGVFSLPLDVMRSHFQLLRERGIRVIKLSTLTGRLENPKPFHEKVVVITFDDGFVSMYTKLLPLAREFGYPITLFVYTDNIYHRAVKKLTWDELRELEESGIEIECHSISHADLEKLSRKNTPESKRKLFEEIYLAKRIVELYLRKRIKYFAFPYGRYDLNLIDLCSNAGYERVFSTDYGPNIITRNNYCLRRRHIKRNTLLMKIESILK